MQTFIPPVQPCRPSALTGALRGAGLRPACAAPSVSLPGSGAVVHLHLNRWLEPNYGRTPFKSGLARATGPLRGATPIDLGILFDLGNGLDIRHGAVGGGRATVEVLEESYWFTGNDGTDSGSGATRNRR